MTLVPQTGELLNGPECAGLVARYFPALRIERMRVNDSGWDSRVLEVNGEYVFRFPRWESSVRSLRREVRLLPELAPLLGIAVPQYEFISPGAANGASLEPAFAGYRMLGGSFLAPQLFRERVHGAAFTHCARQLGEFLGTLHSFPRERAETLGIEVAPPESFLPHLRELQRKAAPLLTVPCRKRVEGLVERAGALWQQCRYPLVLAHNDLVPEHILFDEAAGAISGIVDFGDVMIDDPAGDFTTIYCEYGWDFGEAVLAHYKPGLDSLALARCQVYRRLEPFYWVDYGLQTGKQAYVKAGLTMLENDTHGLAAGSQMV